MSTPVDPALQTDGQRRVLFVVGAGRSGTSTLAGIVSKLGVHVPQPEVPADESNPRGFSEPQWAVDAHDEWLAELQVQVGDARPVAWQATAKVAERERARTRVATWLESHFAVHHELVVKDPRLSWFLELWRAGAHRAGAVPVYATMLRPPAEVVGSRQKYYDNKLGNAHLAASWVNMLLHTELGTRQQEGAPASARAFVRYADLLTDWRGSVGAMGEALGLATVVGAEESRRAEVDAFIDPSLRRVTQTLDDLALPRRLHELTAQTWETLNRMAEPGGDTPAEHAVLDQLRVGYAELYDEAESITRSSVVAARLQGRRAEQREAAEAAAAAPAPGVAPGGDAEPGDLSHRVRSAVPAPLRRAVRRVVPRKE
ncbi:MAG: sulfotransferase family protein [Nocardioides sp.]|uniref:sulfotransferase family protein n=1 Tax=Nocardioides sp. TaxID=35761 RepID=UPI003F0A3169